MLNKDVSQSIWKWGTSISEQASYAAIELQPPRFDPTSTAFKDDIVITLTQPQGFNDNIYVKEPYSDKFKKYTNPIRLTESGTISTLTAMKINGKLYKSPVVSNTYTKCADDEEVVNGECVPASSSSSSSVNSSSSYSLISSSNSSSSSYSSSSSSTFSSIGYEEAEELYNKYSKIDSKTIHQWKNWPNPEHCQKYLNPEKGYGYSIKIDNNPEIDEVRCQYDWQGSGILIRETLFKNGEANGIEKIYYVNGQLYSQIPYKNGVKEGIEVAYYQNGVVSGICPYYHGVRNGIESIFHQSGNLDTLMSYKAIWNNDMKKYIEKEVFSITYYENGAVSGITYYRNGMHERYDSWYNKCGCLLGEEYYHNNKQLWYKEYRCEPCFL